eukprot:PITA_12195
MLSCRLEFECTNNTAEYEALVQGLYKAIGLKVQYLKVFGDSEIIVKQVRNTIHCLSNHLKHYQSLVQELTSNFLAFNISSIPRSQNSAADLLANVASKLLPSEDYSLDRFSVELLFRPSINDNVTNWRVFNHDDDILQFLTSEKSYDNQIIEEDEHDTQMQMFDFAIKRGFKLKYSANYYPQGNGLVESTNINLIKIIKRTIEQNHKNWHKSLIFALWANRITQKYSVGSSPFKLVYGKEAVLPTNLILPSLALVQFIEESPSSSLQLRHDQILKLEEEREKAKIIHAKHQQISKSSFDSISSGSKQFQVGDLVLKWDKAHEDKGKHTKFQKMWLGPFQICEKIGHSTFMLQDLSGLRDSLPVNGPILKKNFN